MTWPGIKLVITAVLPVVAAFIVPTLSPTPAAKALRWSQLPLPLSSCVAPAATVCRACGACCCAGSTPAPLAELFEPRPGVGQRLIFVGGKGGVGKTSTSSALAVRLADSGLSTLIVSTDPAHSLSDALAQDVSGGTPLEVDGCPNLMAMEVETDEAIQRFREAVGSFRAADLGLGGVAEEVISQLGLNEFADILDNVPPGLDELLALAETLAVVRGADGVQGGRSYERVVFDTAPTGHTLRLLAFPDFLTNLLTKLIALRSRLGGALALLGGLLGGANPAAKLDEAVVRLERWQTRVSELQRLLTDPGVTDFVVVSIPSRLAVAESARLLSALAEQGVPTNHLVVNQIVLEQQRAGYVQRVAAEQQRALTRIDSGASPLAALDLARVPFFSMEMRGVYPLKYYGRTAFGEAGGQAESWADVLDASNDRFILVGGKGGVGKTTTSAALAVENAERGYNTLVVSTDPAHSLGDALDVDLSSGEVVRVEGLAGASLYAIEVKVDEAVAEFKRLVGGLGSSSSSGGAAGAGATPTLGLGDFADIFDAVPPGVDELIALVKIVALAKADAYGLHFERVVVDTAPTGHTLRLLTFPDFLDRFVDRLLLLQQRFQGAAGVLGGAKALFKNVFGGGGGGGGGSAADAEEEPRAVAALRDFQSQMKELQALLKDPKTTEFVIVSIPTYLSLTESERLLGALRDQGIAVRRGVVNRMLSASDAEGTYLAQLSKGQAACLRELRELAERAAVDVTEVPYFDTECRAIYGLRALGAALLDAKSPTKPPVATGL